MKTISLIFLLAFTCMLVYPQTSQDTTVAKSAITAQVQPVNVDQTGQIVLPALPVKGSSIWTWILWIISAGVAIDTVLRFIPTSGKYSWITKLLGILHDISLYLDNTKTQPDKKV